MDSNVSRTLELGMGFLLFVIGMTLFLSMNSKILTFSEHGKAGSETYNQVQQVLVPVADKTYSVQELYMLLTDRAMQPESTVLNGVSYGGAPIIVTIDGTTFSPVSDFSGRRSLVTALSALTSIEFDPDYVVDGEGRITEIRFTGR